VSVERLAEQIGVSKGSLYWHFADRAALIDAALLQWEKVSTTDVVLELEVIADPRERLRRLFQTAFRDPYAGRIEAALMARPAVPSVRAVLRRVTEQRLLFMNEVFDELGFSATKSRNRSLVAYSVYLGLFSIQQALPGSVPPQGPGLDAYLTDLLNALTSR
jgi:AcrR family transcriptional regulator